MPGTARIHAVAGDPTRQQYDRTLRACEDAGWDFDESDVPARTAQEAVRTRRRALEADGFRVVVSDRVTG